MQIVLFSGSSWIAEPGTAPGNIPFPPNHAVLKSLGPYQIASVLRSNGYSVEVIDHFPYIWKYHNETLEQLISKYVNLDTLWVGFSNTFFDDAIANRYDTNPLKQQQFKNFVNSIKRRNPKTKIVIGGAQSYAYKNTGIADYTIDGYADHAVVEFTKWLTGDNPFYQHNTDPKGSNFDFVNYNFRWDDRDMITPNEVLPLEVGRGCIFRCSFCNYPLNGKKKLDYIKDTSVLRNHLIENYERFGTTNYMFSDDTHNDSVQKLETLYNEVYSKLPFKIGFNAYIRLDLLKAHPHTIQLLKDSGIKSAFFGIESLNHASTKSIGKGLSKENIISTLHKVKECWGDDVYTQAGIIVGLPHESVETAREWLTELVSPNFPLSSIGINALNISKVTKTLGTDRYDWASDFSRDPEKYGYKFETPVKWVNNTGMTLEQAIQLRKEFFTKFHTQKLKDTGKPAGNWMQQWRNETLNGKTVENFMKDYLTFKLS